MIQNAAMRSAPEPAMESEPEDGESPEMCNQGESALSSRLNAHRAIKPCRVRPLKRIIRGRNCANLGGTANSLRPMG